MEIHALKILIIENNYSFALELETLLKDLNHSVIGLVDNSAEAFEAIHTQMPDLILMDTEIKGKLTGVEMAQKIANLKIPILFISSKNDERTYEAATASNMLGFLVKPVEKISLRSTIQMTIENVLSSKRNAIEKENSTILANTTTETSYYFKKRETFHKVLIKDIAFICSDDNYCETHTLQGDVFTSRITISGLEKMLPANIFMRMHRQYIVQLEQIKSINFSDSTLKIGTRDIPVSRSKRKELASLFQMIR